MSPGSALAPAADRPRLIGALLGLIPALLLLVGTPALAQVQVAGFSAELEEQLDRGSARREVARFYERRDWRPLWLAGDGTSPAGDALLRLLEDADADGLDRNALRVAELAGALRNAQNEPNRRNLARAEAALSAAFAAYVQGTRSARDSGMNYQSRSLAPVVPTPAAALEAAATAPSLLDYVRTMGWMHPLYAELRRGLAGAGVAVGADIQRQRQLRLNLQRLRGLPGDPPPRYLLIDAAGARLWMYERGQPVDSMKVVVGKPDQPTPMVAGLVSEAVLNPYWNVPVDLARTRIAPSVLTKGLSYLNSDGYQVLSDFSENAVVSDPATIDWQAVADGRTEVRVRQLPGKANFMGMVKFNFSNPDGVYLHDTPDKALLKAEVRTASAGCVRLEDAARLGRWLLGRPLVARDATAEQVVALSEPVPIYITYLTAAPVGGRIVFRNDVYRRDEGQWAARSD